MRTLQEITDAARRGESATEDELRFAVCAYDVFVAQLELDRDPKQLAKFFIAAESDPREYLGEANAPTRADVQAWHRAFINVGEG